MIGSRAGETGRFSFAARAGRLALALAVTVAAPVLSGPARAASAPAPLSVYGQLPGFDTAAISHSGDHVAILGTVAGERTVLVLDKEGKPVLRSRVGPVKVRGLSWVGDQALLVDYSETVSLGAEFLANRAELGSVLVLPLDGGKMWGVFQGKQAIAPPSGLLMAWSSATGGGSVIFPARR